MEKIHRALNAGLPKKDLSGKITKAADFMLNANIYPFMASFYKFHLNEDKPDYWKQAASAAGSVRTMGYSLQSDYASLFKHSSNNSNNEVILANQYVEDKITSMPPVLCLPAGTGITGEGWASIYPIRDFIYS